MYGVLRQYQIDPKNADRILKEGKEVVVPQLQAIPGFVSFVAVDSGDGTLMTFSAYETRAGADESVRKAATAIREKLSDVLPNPPKVTPAEILVRELTGTPLSGTAYGVMRRYQTDLRNVNQIVERARDGFVPLIRSQPGFRSYQILDAGNGTLVTLTAFETRAGAEDSVTRAATWVRENLASLLPNPPEVTRGEIKLMVMAQK